MTDNPTQPVGQDKGAPAEPILAAVAARIIQCADERGDFCIGDDGFWIYWPSVNHGAHNEWSLRTIADELERRNEPWQQQINDYFVRQKDHPND